MRMLPFFIFIFALTSCSLKNNNDKKEKVITDSIIPAVDTAIKRISHGPVSDPAYSQHQWDSFYAIKPAYLFTSSGKNAGFDKLIAAAIDTNAVISAKSNFTKTENYIYDKDSMPLSKTCTYSNSKYRIEVITKDLDVYQQKKIIINGRPLRWGRDIDTSLTGDFISYNIELYPEDFRLIRFRQKEFLCMTGNIEKCNGNGCGVSYYLLYDPEINKAVALQQYRIQELYLGKFNVNDQLGFLVFEDYAQNYLLQYFTVAAKSYNFSPQGKIVPARDSKGKQFYFDGYSIDDPDSISILKANFPLKK